ncbi:hypothetical protein ABZT03_35235 [Streptomyces sp. NPDC005574]|uniref:hypothetical protein n=1 Tax=Streptomyces sp. NPDC005574 TaxID=3156891 RepID=UPI0033B0467D
MAEKRRTTGIEVGIRRELGDVDRALAYAADLVPAALPAPERRTRAATDTARGPGGRRRHAGHIHPAATRGADRPQPRLPATSQQAQL